MLDLRYTVRYTMLLDQFHMDESNPFYQNIKDSLERIFMYIYNHTDIMYLDFIDEKTLYGYIKYNQRKRFKNITFQQTIKDIKAYLFFLKYIKGKRDVPSVDLSIGNYSLWTRL